MKIYCGSGAHRPKGTALIVSMAIVLLLAGLGLVLMNEYRTRSYRTEVDSEDVKSFEAAEAGLDAAIRSLNTAGFGCVGMGWGGTDIFPARRSSGSWELVRWSDANSDGQITDTELTTVNAAEIATGAWRPGQDGVAYSAADYTAPVGAAKANEFKSGQPLPRPEPQEFNFYQHSVAFGDIRYFAVSVPWQADGVDNDNSGTADDTTERGWYTIYATGFSNPATPEGKFTTVEAIGQRLFSDEESIFDIDAALELQIARFKPAQ